MDEKKKLYPFRFCRFEDTYSWGSETFCLADLGYRDSLLHDGWLAANALSEVMDMYMDRVVGGNVFEYWGRQFPICVRYLKVTGKMPLRVHPDDSMASERYDFLGKEKLWYVVRAGRDARVMLGFRKDTDAGELYRRCLDNSAGEIMNVVAPHAGQAFRIAPGTPHAAAGDMEIIEISESSPLDFCLCGWGEEVSTEEFDESLSMIDALEFIDYHRYSSYDAPAGALVDIPQFKVSLVDLKDTLLSRSGEYESFVLYVCAAGKAAVRIDVLGQTAEYVFGKGEALLVPAECPDFYLAPLEEGTRVLDVTVPFRSDADKYIDPAAREKLPDDED